tara:strand:+ start:293 stop:460 length:168 start_codon:yes stop_codon:yes gene_type:complete
MGDDVKKNQKEYTAKAMYKQMEKRYSPGATSSSGNYTFKHLGHEIVKFDSYTRGK